MYGNHKADQNNSTLWQYLCRSNNFFHGEGNKRDCVHTYTLGLFLDQLNAFAIWDITSAGNDISTKHNVVCFFCCHCSLAHILHVVTDRCFSVVSVGFIPNCVYLLRESSF